MANAREMEPPPKKRKFYEDFDDIFSKVLEKNEDRSVRKQLEKTTVCLERGMNQLFLREIKVIDANANRAVPFSRASIGMTKFEDFDTYSLGTIFARGIAVLKQYLQSDISKGEIFVPEDANYRKALELLLIFLDTHDRDQGAEFLICQGKVEEWQWKLGLAQHLFSKLAVNPSYKYDISYDETQGCPCSVHETMNGERGDTSFGCEKGWHGNIDILMADVPIHPISREPDIFGAPLPSSSESQISDTDSSIGIEVKRSMFNDNDYSQIVAETITFSFLKNKDKSDADVTLIPSIAINKTGVQCFFYDSINDVLLQSGCKQLVVSERFIVDGIVLVWLTLNHQLFCTGTLNKMKGSGFQKLIDLDMYKEQVKSPCRISQDRDQMCISDMAWLQRNDSLELKDLSLIPVKNIYMQKE